MGRTGLGSAVLMTVALLFAACGGSASSPGVARLSSGTSSSSDASSGGGSPATEAGAPTGQQLVAFAQCMRSHGVPAFPEPSGGRLLIPVGAGGRRGGIDPASAGFQAARKACRKLLPSGGVPSPALQAKAQEGALRFSQCMRTHGVPGFPDPTFYGGAVRLENLGAGGVDLGSPQVRAAQRTCQSIVPKLPGAKGGPAEGGAIGAGGPKGGD